MHEKGCRPGELGQRFKRRGVHVAGFFKPPRRRCRRPEVNLGARVSKTNVSGTVFSFSKCLCPRPSRGDLHKMEIFVFGLHRYSNTELTAMRLMTNFQLMV